MRSTPSSHDKIRFVQNKIRKTLFPVMRATVNERPPQYSLWSILEPFDGKLVPPFTKFTGDAGTPLNATEVPRSIDDVVNKFLLLKEHRSAVFRLEHLTLRPTISTTMMPPCSLVLWRMSSGLCCGSAPAGARLRRMFTCQTATPPCSRTTPMPPKSLSCNCSGGKLGSTAPRTKA